MLLKEYQRKRKFHQTPEPKGKSKSKGATLKFVVQRHLASREHYDFRLELDGVLKSWAVPKGPSLTSQSPRLAIQVEDHPLEYGTFEGVIPSGNYGAGTVMVWDSGTYLERSSSSRKESETAIRANLANGHITFILTGQKLRGEFALVRLKKNTAPKNAWLLIKKYDSGSSRIDILKRDRSVLSNRSMKEIESEALSKNEVWIPGKGRPSSKMSAKKQTEMPRRIRTMEPVLAHQAPSSPGWLFEYFGRGPRVIAEVTNQNVHLYSRGHLPLEKKFPAIASALAKQKRSQIVEGEIIRKGSTFVFCLSDVLYLDGRDLRELPLYQRKKVLAKLKLEAPLQMSEAPSQLDQLKLESFAVTPQIVAKNFQSHYHGGISKDWQRFRMSSIRESRPPVTHGKKIYWPDEGITKSDLISYYDSMSSTILPHLINRPQSLHRQPGGIRMGFFHKDMGFLPRRVKSVRIASGSSGRTINYALCEDSWSLLYLINLGCIELNPWLSRFQNLDKPEFVVIDLDPASDHDGNHFHEVILVAQEVHRILKSVKAESYCKTSGVSGLHICIPTAGKFDFQYCRAFAEQVCREVNRKLPKLTSLERSPAKRRGKIYLDFLQNRRAQTLAAPYCVRPVPKACVSAPLKWTEVKTGLRPELFTIHTMPRRIKKVGDLWKPLLTRSVDLNACMRRLAKMR